MDIFHPFLMQVRDFLKPVVNMKTATSMSNIMTGLMNRTGLPAALRRSVQGWGLAILGIIIGVALVLSLLSRSRRDEWSVRPCWQEKNQWIAFALALILGSLGIHRMYMRRPVTGACQLIGLAPFLSGALLLSEAKMTDFVFLTDNVVGGIILFVIGLAFVAWRVLDLFMILFGGLVPRKKRVKTEAREKGKQEAQNVR